jgi:hypothetical protein
MIMQGLGIAKATERAGWRLFYKTATDQPHARNGVMRRAKGTRSDPHHVTISAAGDTVDAQGIMGFSMIIVVKMMVSRRNTLDLLAPG